MARALERYFGAEPDLDIEAQRAIIGIKKPMAIDWKAIDAMIKRASFTFGGAHIRARGQVVPLSSANGSRLAFEFAGTSQRIELKNPERARGLLGQTVEIAGRIEDWKSDAPRLLVLDSR